MSGSTLLDQIEAIAFEANQRLERAALRSTIAHAPRIAAMAWNVVPGHAQPLWTVRLAPRHEITSAVLTSVLASLRSAKCTWTWGSLESPLTGLAACSIEVPDGPRMELIFTLPRMIGQLGIVRRQGVMCLTTEPFRPTPKGVLQGDIVFWRIDETELTRVIGGWLHDTPARCIGLTEH
jgi:hypothetical protein